MNALLYSSIQTAAYGNLFECSTASVEIGDVVFSSMRHDNIVGLSDDGDALIFVSLLNTRALKTKFPDLACEEGLVIRHKANDLTDHIGLLGTLFRSAAELPRDPATVLPDRTERFATVKARLGQHRYKIKQADLWGNACAVTGIAEPSLLRASHAKPWSESTDAENGNLDPEVTLRDVRSHEEDVEEVERQLSKIECDGFYEDGGEFYVWFDGNEPPWDGFDAGTDLCDIHDVAEVLVSEGED